MPDDAPQNAPHGLSPTGCPISAEAASFRPYGPEYQRDPAEACRWSREREPVFYAPDIGYWVVTRYEDVKAVFRDNILFSPANALEKMTPATEEAQAILRRYDYNLQRTMVNEDEPDHMERRRLLMDDFLPERLAKHEPMVRRLTRAAMDRFIDRGRAELMGDIFKDIPLAVALKFLGVSDEDSAMLRRYAAAHTLNTWGRPTPEQQIEIAENVGRFWRAANEILDRMIAEPDGEGWMYETVRQHFRHPDIVPESYMRSMMLAILVAAHETTSLATGNAFRILLSNRAAWEELCENPGLIPSAVEECLRVGGSIVAWRRVATADAEIGGVRIPKGGKLLIVQASANRDALHWENPEEIDIHRDNAVEHLSFGYGAHQCMGKNIARMEMRVFLEEFTRRLPHMRLVEGQRFESLPNISFLGPMRLEVEWSPEDNPERRDPSILETAVSFPIGPPARDDILRRVVVREVRDEAEGVKSFLLADPRGRPLPRWSAGAHVDLVAGGFRRKYSLCGGAEDEGFWRIAILREAEGRGGSRHFCDHLAAGDEVRIAGPRNHFRMEEGEGRHVLIAGGVGVTPILAMADRLKARGRPYELHYCGRERRAMAFLERIERDHGEALSLHVSGEGPRMDLSRDIGRVAESDLVYACGPERMLDELQELAAGWPEGALRFEYFSSEEGGLDPSKEHGFEVELADSGLTISVAPDETLFEALRRAGVDIQTDCGEGLCGTCEARVLEGAIDHRDRVLSRTERARGDRMMTCCSRAAGARLKLAL